MADPRDDPRKADAGPDILANERARQEVANQQATQVVTEAVRRANNKVLVRPAEAIADLKQTLDDVRNNPDLSERTRVDLVDRLERASQTIDRTGRRVQAEQEQAQAAAASAAAKAAAGPREELVAAADPRADAPVRRPDAPGPRGVGVPPGPVHRRGPGRAGPAGPRLRDGRLPRRSSVAITSVKPDAFGSCGRSAGWPRCCRSRSRPCRSPTSRRSVSPTRRTSRR